MSVNVPTTIWQDNRGDTEYGSTGVYNIVDTVATFLVDPSGVFIVDTGVLVSTIPATIWAEDDSL